MGTTSYAPWRAVSGVVLATTTALFLVAAWCGEIPMPEMSIPLVFGALLSVWARTAAFFLLIAAVVPCLLLVPLAAWADVGVNAAGYALLVGFVLAARFGPRMVRLDRAATLSALSTGLAAGGLLVALIHANDNDLMFQYWTWQGERAAASDWAAGRLLVPEPNQLLEEARDLPGIEPGVGCVRVRVIAGGCIEARQQAGCIDRTEARCIVSSDSKHEAQRIGYWAKARELAPLHHGWEVVTGSCN